MLIVRQSKLCYNVSVSREVLRVMVKLYMKQKAFSWPARFTVKDAQERDCYTVEGERFAFGRCLHIFDMMGSEVAVIRQKAFAFRPQFSVWIGGVETAQIVKELSFLRPRYRIEGPDWEISGDFWAHTYEISSRGLPVAAVEKTWMSWGDSYAIEIAHPENTLLALCVVLAIDCVLQQQAAAASAAT